MTDVLLGETYPATTSAPPPSRPGLVVHSLYDISMYAGTAAGERYDMANSDEERDAALRDMPDATVVFSELTEGEEFFPLPPSGIFDDLPEPEPEPEDDGSEPRDFLGEGKKD